MEAAALRFGGIDILVQTAAVFFPPDSTGRIPDHAWRKTIDVNLAGAMIALDPSFRPSVEAASAIVAKAAGAQASVYGINTGF